jgi:SagB-type dehydrogenase family enzyme
MLMEQRQTRREFTRELSMEQLGEFLWLACRSRSSRESPYGPNQESRPHPSAGALHPIHVLVARDAEALFRYDPLGHALVEIPVAAPNAGHAVAAARASLEIGRGWVLALVAEPGKTGSKYENPETLVWRDAGVVLGYMSVVAEALGMAFCPLGISGGSDVTSHLPSATNLHGVGLAVLGGS